MLDTQLIEIAEYAKKLIMAKKASDAVISVQRESNSEVKFVNNEIVKTTNSSDSEITVFAVLGKKIASTSIKELEKAKVAKTIDKLEKFTKQILPKEDYFGIADGPFKYKRVEDLFDAKIVNISAKDQVDYVETGINAALEQGALRASGIFQIGHVDTYLTTSRGAKAKNEKSGAYFSIRGLINEESSGHNTTAACMLRDLGVFRAGAAAGEMARLSRNPEKGKGGKYDIIFSPLAFSPLLSIAGGMASIFSVEAGLSVFKGKTKKKIANESVTLVDNGPLPGGFGAMPFDEEGVPTQKNVLIDKGVFNTYLYNTSFARKYKTKTTGNAGLVDPTNWQIVLEPGKLTKEKLFSQVKNGIYISNVWYTRFQNYSTGDFSTIPRDGMFIIKDGEFHKPIKHLRVSENLLNILQNISAVAKDSRQVYSWEIGESGAPVTMPHVLVKNVNLTQPTA
jgi:PmbA protein